MKAIFRNIGISLKLGTINIIILANAFIWYFLAFGILRQLMTNLNLSNIDVTMAVGVNIAAIGISAIVGSILVDRFKKRVPFLCSWTMVGIFLSLIPLIFKVTNFPELIGVSIVFGLYFGIGMPATMGFFAASTTNENRSRLGGLTFLIIGLSFSILGNLAAGDIVLASTILTAVRIAGLILIVSLRISKIAERDQEKELVSYKSIVTSKSFMLYFVPWCMFNLVSYLTVPFMTRLYTQGSYFQLVTVIENILVAAFAVISGFLSDRFGRKRLTIVGFSMLGIGYAVLGLSQASILGWYFYVVVDGIAWGVFYTVLVFTVWGDLAHAAHSEKYYVMGALPYLFSDFMRLLLGPYIEGFQADGIFTFACIFLFLAVLPLIYAPETLSEKVMKDRDLKSYVEKAMKKVQTEFGVEEKARIEPQECAVEFQVKPEENDKEQEEAERLAEKYY